MYYQQQQQQQQQQWRDEQEMAAIAHEIQSGWILWLTSEQKETCRRFAGRYLSVDYTPVSRVSIGTQTEESPDRAEIQLYEKKLREAEAENRELEARLQSMSLVSHRPQAVAGIENVNSRNRPSLVAQAFTELMNNQWLDALLAMNRFVKTEEAQFRILKHFFELSVGTAEKWLEEFLEDKFPNILHNAVQPKGINYQNRQRQEVTLPPELRRHVVEMLSENWDSVDVGDLKQDIGDYIAECCRVALRMVLQHPKMELAAPHYRLGQVLDPLTEELYADSKPRGTISAYVKAGLIQGDKYFVKPLVILS